MGPGGLRALLDGLAPGGGGWDDHVLVGLAEPDDAAVVSLSAGMAAVLTTDLITPACDDPFLFGQLAASNALSDVYAMGGRPLVALNICCLPDDELCPADVKRRILDGMAERVHAAGASVVGGHSVRDAELKVGLCVMGQVPPTRVLRKGGLKAGQALILTKPLGVGVLINGYRREVLGAGELEDVLREHIALNRDAAEVAVELGATGATDVTGFGLLGHALEMARGAKVTLEIVASSLPAYPGAIRMLEQGVSSRGQKDNEKDLGANIEVGPEVKAVHKDLGYDPQTAGGLLFGVEEAAADACVRTLHERGVKHAVRIGTVRPGAPAVRLV